ncbi:fimbrial protein [Escherichia coli]|nr:fimbrial protein [Escherichia coli]MDY9212517.1 fimbrial protein [Escherichia coli]MDY9267089.1 fimbrial protein [Escherichia coli]MDY9321872.1 fimbrial protein [Escherichia coli]MDY9326742.1 fimbrial protein [Escherichia coli]
MKTLTLTSLLLSGVAHSMNLNFKGNLIIPNCTVNANKAIETEFKDVEIQTLTTMNVGYHWQSLTIPVDCPYNLGTPKIKITGDQTTKPNGIKTSKYAAEKLAIYLKQGTAGALGNDIALNSYNALTGSSITGVGTKKNISIAAGIGREGGMDLLKPGPFTASANMEVRYE